MPDAVWQMVEEAEGGEGSAVDRTRTKVQWRYDPLCPGHVDRLVASVQVMVVWGLFEASKIWTWFMLASFLGSYPASSMELSNKKLQGQGS